MSRFFLVFLIGFFASSAFAVEYEYAAPHNIVEEKSVSEMGDFYVQINSGYLSCSWSPSGDWVQNVVNSDKSIPVWRSGVMSCVRNDGGTYTRSDYRQYGTAYCAIGWTSINNYDLSRACYRVKPDIPDLPPGDCPDGQIKYDDGECAPPPDCAGSAGEETMLDALASCVDHCEVSNCLFNEVGPPQGPKEQYYICVFTGNICQSGGDSGGGDSGGGSGDSGDGGGSDPDGGDGSGNGDGGNESGGNEPGDGEGGGGSGGDGPGGGGSGGDGAGDDDESKCPDWLKWICGDSAAEDPEVPDNSAFEDVFFNGTFDELLAWSANNGQGACQSASFNFWGRTFTFDLHCTIAAQTWGYFEAVMMCVWSFVAFKIVMRA
jgi:hypothetical protein